jgi:hypothetical protein
MMSEIFDKDGRRITLDGNVIPDGATLRGAVHDHGCRAIAAGIE